VALRPMQSLGASADVLTLYTALLAPSIVRSSRTREARPFGMTLVEITKSNKTQENVYTN